MKIEEQPTGNREGVSAANQPVIVFRGVSFSYEDVPVLEDVDITIRRGDLTCIVGPNGGGKSTVLKLALGLIHPDAGKVRLFGEPPELNRHRVGYMPQRFHFDPQFPVSVLDIVLMGRLQRSISPLYTKHDKETAVDALARLGLSELSSSPFSNLSGGQRQRVLIARALACEPDLLLLDEPTANVDSVFGVRLVEILQELNRHMTIVMVSHDLGFVSEIVKNVICVNRRVAEHPTCDITGEIIKNMYGGVQRMVRHDQLSPEAGKTDA